MPGLRLQLPHPRSPAPVAGGRPPLAPTRGRGRGAPLPRAPAAAATSGPLRRATSTGSSCPGLARGSDASPRPSRRGGTRYAVTHRGGTGSSSCRGGGGGGGGGGYCWRRRMVSCAQAEPGGVGSGWVGLGCVPPQLIAAACPSPGRGSRRRCGSTRS